MKVYTVADHIISPLGSGTAPNFAALQKGDSGIKLHAGNKLFPRDVYAAIIDRNALPFQPLENFTFLENLLIHSIQQTLREFSSLSKDRTVLVISTTKGNIDLLDQSQKNNIDRQVLFLPEMATRVNRHFGFPHVPVIVSNACISGLSAILVAKKLIASGNYDHAVVTGADIVTEFVLSGFHSFMALSDNFCRPYDEQRNGINIGEACGTMLLSNDPELCQNKHGFAEIAGGGQSNDANHISGPSRTGEGLVIATKHAMRQAEVDIENIDYINAHGTATLYNDEMEAQAFDHLTANEIPLNSLKGYYGHTLGASGIIESILAIWQMNHNLLLKSAGYENPGVTKPLNVIQTNTSKETRTVLKTSSGFGGCNGAVIFKKP